METEIAATAVQTNLNVVWTLIAGILVFTMQAGFALVETGFTRAKNAANIMMKNLMDFAAGALAFYVLGAALMFGASKAAGWLGWGGLGMPSLSAGEGSWDWTFFFFQTMFAATAATIVSGAVAERIEFKSYLVYSVLVSAVVYPVSGHWMWGGLAGEASQGWIEKLGFHDFAGSTVVHSVGGWIALAGAMALGPRIGKYRPDGSANPIPGHSLVLGTLGVFLLWIGWFGFNPGSYTEGVGSIGRVAMTTNLAACAGTCAALATAWIVMGKPDLTMALNGTLAGLVAITAPCDVVTANASIAIGAIAGVLVVFSVFALDRLHIDDPVGAVSVHCVNGVWGTLATGIFAAPLSAGYGNDLAGLAYGGGFKFLGIQLAGAGATAVWAFGCGWAVFRVLKACGILRVSAKTELKGLDVVEHGEDAYASFQFFSNI
ncbi:MAG: ammonium transporter [Kiritimatiellae bacterium]|nr:ammonium transporter [Kiritimatiellia bacterium]MBR1837626.1 ammonium transporter [Kiritimatiellia bacterium]